MVKQLVDKVCIVAGGTKGIGFAIAKNFVERGAYVYICGRSDLQAKKAALKIDPRGEFAFGMGVDVIKQIEIESFVNKIINRFHRIDVLVNTAGIFAPFGLFEKIPIEEIMKNVDVNLGGSMRLSHEVIPFMKKHKFGRIILFSGGGIGGDIPLENASAYYTSKGGLTCLTEALAAELKNYNITVNAILPGQILTQMTKSTFKYSDEQLGPVLSKFTKNLKLMRGQRLEPVINLVNFLVSRKASHVNGKLLSARWDSIPKLAEELPSSEYTLRRIKKGLYEKVVKS